MRTRSMFLALLVSAMACADSTAPAVEDVPTPEGCASSVPSWSTIDSAAVDGGWTASWLDGPFTTIVLNLTELHNGQVIGTAEGFRDSRRSNGTVLWGAHVGDTFHLTLSFVEAVGIEFQGVVRNGALHAAATRVNTSYPNAPVCFTRPFLRPGT